MCVCAYIYICTDTYQYTRSDISIYVLIFISIHTDIPIETETDTSTKQKLCQIRNVLNKNYNRNISAWTLKHCLLAKRIFPHLCPSRTIVKQRHRKLPDMARLTGMSQGQPALELCCRHGSPRADPAPCYRAHVVQPQSWVCSLGLWQLLCRVFWSLIFSIFLKWSSL